MRYRQRTEPLHEVGECNDLDVMVVRGLDLRGSRAIQHALESLGEQTGGVIEPISIGEIPFPIFGGPLLKRAVMTEKINRQRGSRSQRGPVISVERMDDVRDEIMDAHSFEPLTLRVLDPRAPFRVDEHDQLVVALNGKNRQFEHDQKGIMSAMKSILGGVSQGEIDATTYFKPPKIVVATVNRHVLGVGDDHDRFMENPNTYLADVIKGNRTLADDFEEEVRLFPNRCKFGDPKVVTRMKVPSHIPMLEQAEAAYDIEFDGLIAVRKAEDDWADFDRFQETAAS